MNTHYQHLDFYLILNKLADCAFSAPAQKRLKELEPITDELLCQRAMSETTEAKKLLCSCGSPPLASMENLEEILCTALAGGMLSIEQLEEVSLFCLCCKRMSAYLSRGKLFENQLSVYSNAFEPLDSVQDAIEDAILHGSIRDDASPSLRHIRHTLLGVESKIKEKLNRLLHAVH